jgi:CRISPR system Cascade subunit CasD
MCVGWSPNRNADHSMKKNKEDVKMQQSTITIRLKGPIASFNDMPKTQYRLTRQQPTKTAIVGLLAACLGRKRDEDLSDLMELDIAIHGPNPKHEVLEDYQTIRNAVTNNGDSGRNGITTRWYLQDVDFLINISGSSELVEACEKAIVNPWFPPYAGRKNCVLTEPLLLTSLSLKRGQILR